MADETIKCTIFGSFHKFKEIIDTTAEEFERIGVEVLAPKRGILCELPSTRVRLQDTGYRPLRAERDMDPKLVEDEFLASLGDSDFVYLVNPKGYVGQAVSMELGFCMAQRIPVYASAPIAQDLDQEIKWATRSGYVWAADPHSALKDYLEKGPQIRFISSINSMIK